jgi:hypothetical protein
MKECYLDRKNSGALKAYINKNIDRIRKYRKEYMDKPRLRFYKMEKRCQQNGMIFELTLENYENNFYKKPCKYCGQEAKGVDRVDNNKGYLIGNMVPCCWVCNKMKIDHSKEDFIAQCKRIVMNYKEI